MLTVSSSVAQDTYQDAAAASNLGARQQQQQEEEGNTSQLRRNGVVVYERLVYAVDPSIGNGPGGISSITQKQKYQQFRVRVRIPHVEPGQPSMRAELISKFVLLNRVIRFQFPEGAFQVHNKLFGWYIFPSPTPLEYGRLGFIGQFFAVEHLEGHDETAVNGNGDGG